MELIIEDIFQVKLPGSETNNPQYTVLSDEIDRNIDGIILAQLTENEQLLEPFAYLNNCYNRTLTRRRKNKNAKELQSSFDEIETLLVGYGLVAFQIEEFCMNGNFKNYIKKIIEKVDDYTNFIPKIIERANQEGSLLEFLTNVFTNLQFYLTKDMAMFDINDSMTYNNTLSIYEMFLTFKPVAAIFTKVEGFFADYNCKANEFEKVTILGPILTLSPLNPNVALRNYGDNLERSKQQTMIIHESLQAEHKVIIERLFFVIDKIIRGSEESRSDMISYFAQIVNKNHLRRGDHANQNKLASNAFMTNITLILVKFSQPFLDVSYKKIDKIDVNYFNTLNLYLDLSQETRLNSDFKEADEFYDRNKKDAEMKPNFISDCFFLTLTYLQYGLGGILLYDEKITPQLKRLREEIERVKEAANSQDMFASFANMQLKQMEKTLKITQSIRSALQGFFTHRNMQLEVFDFICGASTFLMRVIDPNHQYPAQAFKLPLIPDQVGFENVDNAEYLRKNAPVPFKYYPEFCVEGPINYALYIAQYSTSPLFRNPRLQSFLEFGTTILRCPELVSNPHLKGKLVQLFSVGAMPLTDGSPGFMMEIFEHDELIKENLLYALLDFYVIVEKTGSSSQFYDKFNSRYSISIILEELYSRIPLYKNQLIWQSQKNSDFFIRFVARMLNDLTFLLDEGLSSLADVHNIQNEIENRAKGNQPTREENDQELQSKLMSAERQAKSSCGLAGKSLKLFEIFTADIPSAFCSSEIVDRLASMLNYNLVSLVGPKCGELKVKNPEKYSFHPKQLLKALTTVYVNLAGEDEFISAIARDSRSFDTALFERAVHILQSKIGLVSPEFCDKLMNLALKAEERKNAEEEEDMEYGDAPEEFLDPLMYTIMKDPVTLPTSKVNIDRATIKAHLLSDSTDPFNRMPLKLEQVIPNTELKQKIEEYKKNKKMKK
ncbi:Ubiquitin elongating factor core [Nakaseomyces glabratus]|nr:Ubiquitin elongating factor core [Nakaseomyces glabratus]KAH7597945.1 Ubiquitin elongating factor core [Nakaseomyces glabratus]KAH7612239.1 Ubiquitin elongating factor core [Nakaseomyces glabratus]